MSADGEPKEPPNYATELQELINTSGADSLAGRLAVKELERVKNGAVTGDPHLLEVVSGKPCKLSFKVLIPAEQFPKINFVGKILGPRGNSLKRLQEQTRTRMAILGRGSMRDRSREEQLRREGGRHDHLNEPLHVWIEAFDVPSQALSRLSHAVAELRKFLNPDYDDDIRQRQMDELGSMRRKPDRDRGYPPGPDRPPLRGGPMDESPRGGPPRMSPMGGRSMPPVTPRGGVPMRPGLPRDDGMPRGSPSLSRPAAPRSQNEYYDYGHGDDDYGYNDGFFGPSGFGKSLPRGRGDYRTRPY